MQHWAIHCIVCKYGERPWYMFAYEWIINCWCTFYCYISMYIPIKQYYRHLIPSLFLRISHDVSTILQYECKIHAYPKITATNNISIIASLHKFKSSYEETTLFGQQSTQEVITRPMRKCVLLQVRDQLFKRQKIQTLQCLNSIFNTILNPKNINNTKVII